VRGLWNWPAGHVDPGETLQQAAVRETKEETGFDVRLTGPEPLYTGQGHTGTTHKVHLFHGEISGGSLQFQEGELLDARWFSPDEIRQLAAADKTRGVWVIAGLDIVENHR
jgi:8-oxo-dGTP pyrophosphatase MutT (NUDIX family)